MCGIAGYAGRGKPGALRHMAAALVRRGPDDEGFHAAPGVGFAFRRLSIIDVSRGHQPLSNEDGSVWVMLNGEIYGFDSLRAELVEAGHVFRTHSDTEVIVHAYETWGDDCLRRIHGMFAIALWDGARRRLLLARDRLGKKPLYWTIHAGELWFASEAKALLAAGVVKRELEHAAMVDYFRTDAVPTPHSIWKDVYKLEPASALVWSDGKIEQQWTFWKPASPPSPPLLKERGLGGEAVETFGNLIDLAVKERLVSDVPLGIFLSGGLDSLIIAESAARQARSKLHAYTIGFDDPTHDETAEAALAAKTFGLEHHIERLSSSSALAMLDEATECLDEPLSDPAVLPQLLLTKFARRDITVALSGDGGDELLLGYQHIPAHVAARRHPWIWQRSIFLKRFFLSLPASAGYFSSGFKLQRLARGFGLADQLERDLAWRGAWTKEDASRLLDATDAASGQAEKLLQQRAQELSGDWSAWQRWSWAYLRSFLMDEVLVKVDRATMWFGLEARAPLLDTRVVEYALSLPDAYKLGAWKGKRLFKEILQGRVPRSLLDKPKHGFGVPIADWLKGPLKKELAGYVEQSFLAPQGLFDRACLQRMLHEHARGRPDRRRELWAYLMFQRWYQRWMK